jgi:glycosyltransferase involved in cell wall biosynthesis
MAALSRIFDETRLVVPCSAAANPSARGGLVGHRLSVAPLTQLEGSDFNRKLRFPFWAARNAPRLIREAWRADAIHAPIPGDVGTLGLLIAFLLRKRLLVRHCGNWFVQTTTAERLWKWFMERFAGGRNVMLATGGAAAPPSDKNPHVRWIFSTTLTQGEIEDCSTPRAAPPAGRARMIIVCRQERLKGTGTVLKSIPLLREVFPQVTLDVVGYGSALQEFKDLAAAEGIGDRVRFHGNVDHETVLRLLQGADIFCYPTAASEGFPKVVLEALACGLPIITTRVSVLPQLVESGCGLLLDEAGPEALARAVAETLSDAEGYERMSAQAAATARRYSLEEWTRFIQHCVESSWGEVPAECLSLRG